MKRNLLLKGLTLAAFSAQMAAAQEIKTGPTSSHAPYIHPLESGAKSVSLLTVGDNIGGYRMVGLPDGLGAYDNGDGTFTVLMNHELGATAGVVRAHGSTGAFVSKWVVSKSDLSVLSGSDLIRNAMLWNRSTGSYTLSNAANPSPLARFGRFCSADLPAPSAFYNAATGLGTPNRIFMNGEETGTEGRGMAHIVTGPAAGTSYELPRLGRYSYENAVANPATGDKTVVIGLDDATPGEVYVYIGTKTNSGSDVEKAGLTNGRLYGLAVTGLTIETNGSVPAPNTPFTLADLGTAENMTGAQLQSASINLGVTRFLRPEDGAWDPRHPEDFYFVTTNSFSGPSRLWKAHFTDINDMTKGGTITVMLNGTEGQRMLDNIGFDQYGNLILQEDVGNNVHNGKMWQYNVDSRTLKLIAKHDPLRFERDMGSPLFLTQDEEGSGVIDMQHILGAGWFLSVDQAHYPIPGELVEGGQLLAFFNPDTYNAACANFKPAIKISPSPTVTGQDANTIYLGYGPQAVTLQASVEDANTPFQYSWTDMGATTASVEVSPQQTTSYTVELTNNIGCRKTATTEVIVKDIRDGSKDKVFLCHNGNGISVSVKAVPAHLNNGAKLGQCNSPKKPAKMEQVTLFPNPASNGATVQFTLVHPENVLIRVVDGQGYDRLPPVRQVYKAGTQQVSINTSSLKNGIYYVHLTAGNETQRLQLMISK
jgi:hypothetical protein